MSPSDFAIADLPVQGLPLSHIWRGYGSALFFEIGALRPTQKRGGQPGEPEGEFTLMIEWGWKVEGRRSILCGSDSGERYWARAERLLRDQRVAGLSAFGRLPELQLCLANDVRVITCMTAEGSPAWTLFDRRVQPVRWYHVRRGRIVEHLSPGDGRQHPHTGGVLTMNDHLVRRRWAELYRRIQSMMSAHGEESYLGDADFWVLDDFSEYEQKVIVSNRSLFRREIAIELQSLLKGSFSDWIIVMQYETFAADECYRLLIRENAIERLLDGDDPWPSAPSEWQPLLSFPPTRHWPSG